ncbi:hypothetical protein SCUP234_05256 [Seiridium cupressi]
MLLANKWKSDTITSFTKTEVFMRRKEDKTRELSEDLKDEIARWIGDSSLTSHGTFVGEMVQQAVDLHQELTCTSFDFFFDTHGPARLVRGEVPDESRTILWGLLDVVKWRPLHGNIGGIFQCLYPALYRRGSQDEEDVLVVPPVILAYDLTLAKVPRISTQRAQHQRSPPRSLKRDPERSPRRSPERHNQSHSSAARQIHANTFPLDEAIMRRGQDKQSNSFISSSRQLFDKVFLFGDKRPTEESSRNRPYDSTEDRTSPLPSLKTPSSLRPRRPSEATIPTAKPRRKSWSKTQSRRHSEAGTSSLLKTTPTAGTVETLYTKRDSSADRDENMTALAPSELYGKSKQTLHADTGDPVSEYDHKIVVNEYGAKEQPFEIPDSYV